MQTHPESPWAVTVLCATCLAACAAPDPPPAAPGQPPADHPGFGGNVLVVLMDDVGVDKIGAYGAHPSPARTPVINALAEEGVRFTQAYADPSCTPTRASLLTGRLPRSTGLGRWIFADSDGFDLDPQELTIPELLGPQGYTSALAGKWHLQDTTDPDNAFGPLDQGFDFARGPFANPTEAFSEGHIPRSYEDWEKVVDGEPGWTETYLTTDNANEAIGFIETLPEPWFVYLAFSAPHSPLHSPPAELLAEPLGNWPSSLQMYDAMLEALDTELGRVLAAIDDETRDRTTVMVIGDNGTPQWGIAEPWDPTRFKGSAWEAGVRVPFIATGPFVPDPGSTRDHLVHVADIFPTTTDIARVDISDLRWEDGRRPFIYGRSLLPALWSPEEALDRELLVTGGFYPNGDGFHEWEREMIRNQDLKLMRVLEEDGSRWQALYEIGPELHQEGEDLLANPLDADTHAAFKHLELMLDLYQASVEVGP